MGSKKEMVNELVNRCKAVDWEVTMGGSGHWRVKTHENKVFSIAGSSSDVHGMKNAERRAIRFGLAKREQEYALVKAKQRLERLEEDRANGVDWEAEEQKIKEQKRYLGYVNGVGIVERVPARAAHPRSLGKTVDIEHGVELALEDASVIFQCTHPVMLNHKYQECGRHFEAANSLRTHISWHARAAKKESEEETAAILADDDTMQAIAEADAEEYVERAMKEDGVDELDVIPRSTFQERVTDLKSGESMTVKVNVEVVEPERGIIAELTHLGEHAQSLIDELDRVGDELDTIRQGVSVLREDITKAVQRVASEHVDVDELRRKAERYDAIVKIAK